MDFHHLDPKSKDFRISSGRSIGWEKREIEVRLKHKKRSGKSIINCSFCKKEFKISLSRRYKVKNPFCSHECSEKFNEKIKWPTNIELKN